MGQISKSTSEGYDGEVEYAYHCAAPPLINDKGFSEKIMKGARKIIDTNHMKEEKTQLWVERISLVI